MIDWLTVIVIVGLIMLFVLWYAGAWYVVASLINGRLDGGGR